MIDDESLRTIPRSTVEITVTVASYFALAASASVLISQSRVRASRPKMGWPP